MSNNLVIGPKITTQNLYEGVVKNASVSDEYLLECATAKASKDTLKSKTAKAYKAMPWLTSVGFVTYSALTQPGTLSKKIGAGAVIAGLFAGVDIGLKAYRKIKNKVQEKRGEQEPKQSKHPVLKTVLGVTGALAAIVAGYFGLTRGASAFAKTDLGTKVVGQLSKLGNKIDAWKFAKKINPEVSKGAGKFVIDEFFKKHPTAKAAAFLAPIAGTLVGSSILGSKLNKKFNKEVVQNYEAFVNEREDFRTSAKFFEMSGLAFQNQDSQN